MNEINQLSPNYKHEVAQYTPKDALHALYFATYILLLTLAFWVLTVIFDVSGMAGQLSGVLLVIVALMPLFYVIRRKRQELRSLGLHSENWKRAIIAGLFFVAVLLLLYNGLLSGLIAGWQFRSAWTIAWLVIYTLIMAFWEDVVFIGYIQTRLYGLIDEDLQAVFVGGLIFAAFHYPLVCYCGKYRCQRGFRFRILDELHNSKLDVDNNAYSDECCFSVLLFNYTCHSAALCN